MEPFDSFRIYMAIKLHFQGSYDAFKYNFKAPSAKPQAFWKRKDKFFFAKLAKKYSTEFDLRNFFVSQFINGKTWVGDMMESEENYTSWLKRNQSIGYEFEKDLLHLQTMYESFDQLFEIDTHPRIVNVYMQDEISLETVVIINKLTGFMQKADAKITETIMWPEISLRIRKYDPFLTVDLDKMKKIVLKVFTS